jgi:hypothetical protein
VIHDRAFNVGTTAENYQVREVAEIVGEVVPGSKVGFAGGAGPDTRNYRVDCNRICKELDGFKPQWTIRRGIEELYDAFSTHGLELADFEGERYKRIAHIKKRVAEGSISGDLRPVADTPQTGTVG